MEGAVSGSPAIDPIPSGIRRAARCGDEPQAAPTTGSWGAAGRVSAYRTLALSTLDAMRSSSLFWVLPAALVGLAGCQTTAPAAPADDAAPSTRPAATAPPTARPSAAPDNAAELEAAYWARIREARTRYTQADVDFMAGMIGHHAQALVMSAWAPTNGASPAVQRLAARIINAQRDEIETMQRWLRDRGQAVPLVHIEGSTLRIHMQAPDASSDHEGMDHGSMDHGNMDHGNMDHGGMDHEGMDHGAMHGGMDHAGMPGMLSQAQMDELEAARGVAFDRLFLRYMIQHHGGAVTMVNALFEADGAANDEDAFKVASDVQVDQRTEIARMQQMLDALPPDDSDR